ncbi:hypothetical protein F4779DRAFT_619595 [Xylariaceae sp. FL0662B]|nr:hypothetical protein F4779DRAFT_619595 [Xylariaceae sp. FL0662B]
MTLPSNHVPTNFTASDSVRRFYLPPLSWLTTTQNRQCARVEVGAIVFGERADRVLLLQRSGSPTRLPGTWEIPGGEANDHIDSSILAGVVRGLWEKTKLRATHVKKLVGTQFFTDDQSGDLVCKHTFVVEVENRNDIHLDDLYVRGVYLGRGDYQWHIWVTREEAEAGVWRDYNFELRFSSERQREIILRAFENRENGEGVNGT